MQYAMHGYEPGLYMEIYLQKKTIYQPLLFDVLTKGFDMQYVTEHFLNPDKRPRILSLIGRNPAWSWAQSYDMHVARLKPIFYGYSMYEVDGVFRGSLGKDSIVEERTQIIRLIFRVDVAALSADAGVVAADYRTVRALVCDYLRAHHREQLIEEATGETRQIYEATCRWRDQLGFFVFGYIVFELCDRIEELRAQGFIAKTEDESWVTNFANIELDRILWKPG
jgi:hypothetical protein